MSNSLVLVADGDPKNLQILKENLEASGFVVITVSNGNKAWEEVQHTPPKLILTEIALPGLDGFQLLERLHADPNTTSIPLIFLTNQREIQQRVRSFEQGAKDYLVKPLHVKEVIAHIRMVLRRLEKRKVEQLETYMKFSGRLDQLSLADLIESFGVERKTGVLSLSNGRRTGQVYFQNGTVINASLGDMKLEQAVYQMFSWNRGFFNMVFRDIDITDEISVSNLGLLLHGIKRVESRDKLIKQLSSPNTSFTVTPTFKVLVEKKKVGEDVANFIKLLDGKRDIEQIIDDSGLDDLVTLNRIVRLYQQGFIKPTIPPVKKPVLRKKGENDLIKIEMISKPTPLEELPANIEQNITDLEPKIIENENLFDIKPRKTREDLEQEIKPIVERIEKERKKVNVPESEGNNNTKDKIPEIGEFQTDDPLPRIPVPTMPEPPKKRFIDEELLKQPIAAEDIQKKPEHVENKINAVYKRPTISDENNNNKNNSIELEAPDKNNIIVISTDDDCKDELMDILTDDKFQSRTIEELDNHKIDVGRINFEGFKQYNIISLSVEKSFNLFLKSLKNKISGNILVIDCSRTDTWEYTNYLIHSIWYKFKIPYVIAVMNFHEQSTITMDVLRYQLNLDDSVPMIAWDSVDKASIRQLLSMVTKSNQNINNRKASDVLDSIVEKMMI